MCHGTMIMNLLKYESEPSATQEAYTTAFAQAIPSMAALTIPPA